METPMNSAAPSSKGPIIGIVIIVLILVVGSIYAVSKNRDHDMDMATTTIDENESVSDIEADLQADDLSGIEADFNAAEAELGKE